MAKMDYDVRIKKIVDANKEEFKKVVSLLNALRKELSKFDFGGNYRKLSHFLIKINEITDEEFNNSNHYTNIRGNQELRKLIVDNIKKEKLFFSQTQRSI